MPLVRSLVVEGSKLMHFLTRLLSLASLFVAGTLNAYVTSATLEYSYPHPTEMYLNGVQIRSPESSYSHFEDYALLCSANGTFPLELLNYKKENVLAFRQRGTGLAIVQVANMGISYRLTLHRSSGKPLVIWSEPDHTKLAHFDPGRPVPDDWFKPDFNDTGWKQARLARYITDIGGWPELPDLKFKGPLGQDGFVPFLSHNPVGNASAGMVDVFRSTFVIPDEPGALTMKALPSTKKVGEKMMVALAPSADCASMGPLVISMTAPPGLDPVAVYLKPFVTPSNSMTWNFSSPVQTLDIHLESVLENNGFVMPQKALGTWLPDRFIPRSLRRNITWQEYIDSATFPSASSCWFKMSAPPYTDGPHAPVILEVTFESQIYPMGKNGLNTRDLEHILFNYAVDNSLRGNIFGDAGINVARNSGSCAGFERKWTDGYYNATPDRRWSWSDLANLRVKFSAEQVGSRKRENRLLRCVAHIRYYDPAAVSPFFWAKVREPDCRTLTITASMSSPQNDNVSTGSLAFVVNSEKCPPASIAAAPRPKAVLPPGDPDVPPTPETRISRVVEPMPAVSDVRTGPEPFRRGGVYVYFSSKQAISGLRFYVYDRTGRPVALAAAGDFGAGNNLLYFDGLNTDKAALTPGAYLYELRYELGGRPESFRGKFSKAAEK
jgi:hypothetical protein